MAIAKTPKTETVEPETLSPGFHVTINGVSHGCFPTAPDAENYALGQLTPAGA